MPEERPDPNCGWILTPAMYGVSMQRWITAPISSSLTPSATVMVRVVNTPATDSRSTAASFHRNKSPPR